MKEKPLLSICIPTYNRSKYLKNSLDSIVKQNEFLNGAVEIVISDNASTDDTKEIVESYQKVYKNIYYSRNEENVKDKNYPIVLSKAHGKLRKLCNDTLVFLPNSLKVMCSVVNECNNTKPFIFWGNGTLKINDNKHICCFSDFVKNVSFWITSIACFSIWEDKCKSIGEDFTGCDLSLWQVEKSLKIVYDKRDALIINNYLTDTQIVEKKNISYGLFKVFYENYFSILKPYFDNGSLCKEDIEYLEKDLLFGFFVDWVAKWELRPSNLVYSKTENLKEAVWNAYNNKSYWNEFLYKYYIKLFYIKTKNIAKGLLGREKN